MPNPFCSMIFPSGRIDSPPLRSLLAGAMLGFRRCCGLCRKHLLLSEPRLQELFRLNDKPLRYCRIDKGVQSTKWSRMSSMPSTSSCGET